MKNNKIYQKLIYIISILTFCIFTFELFANRILPLKYRYIFVGVFILLFFIFGLFIFGRSKNKALRVIISIFLILFTAAFIMGTRYLKKGVKTYSNISKTNKKSSYEFSLVVKKDSLLEKLEDVTDEKVVVAYDHDQKNINLFKKEIELKENKSLVYESGKDYLSNAEDLIEGQSEIILLNESYRSSIGEKLPNFSRDTKVIYSLILTKEEASKLEGKEVDLGQPFNIYISGTDAFGEIDINGRTDVNLILSINPKDRVVMMTTVPRDSYLPIAGGGYDEYDKFTHSGIYGIESSIETLERTFDTTIDYYIKVNFSSLIEMVNAMDYVDVVNVRGFKPVFSDEYFPRGFLRVNGEQALHFARERKALSDGDYSRGRNHMRLLEAMIKRATSPSILLNYDKLLDVAVKYMDTNIPYNTLIDLVNNQLENNKDWKILKQDLKGEGVFGMPSFAMPSHELWMFQPYDDSIVEISENFSMFLDGKNPFEERKNAEIQSQEAENPSEELGEPVEENPEQAPNEVSDDQIDNDENDQPLTFSEQEDKSEAEIIKELKLVYPEPYNYQDLYEEN